MPIVDGSAQAIEARLFMRRASRISGGFVEDPTGSPVSSADAGTTAASSSASDSGSTPAEAVAVESQSSEQTDTATPTPDSSETVEDSGDTEGSEDPDEQPRNDEEKKLSRRDRQRLREAERVQQAVADALAQEKREAAAEKEAAVKQAAAEKVLGERREKYSKFVGTPEIVQSLDTEIAELNRQIRAEIVTPTGVDLDSEEPTSLVNQVAAKEAQKAEFSKNQSYEGVIREEVWSQIEGGFTFPATFPELANDPKAKAAYLHAQGGIPGALTVLADTIRSAKDREWQAKLDTQSKTHESALKAAQADRDGWRVRAGGGELSPEDAGSPSYPAGTLTPERYAAMDSTDRAKLRSTPEGRAQIDAMSRRRGAA